MMPGYGVPYLISLVIYTFGALTFSVLAGSWALRGRGRGSDKRAGFPLTALTTACAAAFAGNVAGLVLDLAAGPGNRVGEAARTLAELAIGMIPALWLHVVWASEAAGLKPRWAWRAAVSILYGVSAAVTALRVLGPEWVADRLENAPALQLGAAAGAGLLAVTLTGRAVESGQREFRLRWWYRVLLALTLAATLLGLAPAADYLLLGFFGVTLYYRERIAFFDLLIQRGVYFVVGLAALTFFFATVAPGAAAPDHGLPDDGIRPWIYAVLLTPLWLAAPWLYSRLARALDRYAFGRRYSPVEAERRFALDVQAAPSEEALRARAEASLAAIFRTTARAGFAGAQPGQQQDDGEAWLVAPVAASDGGMGGEIRLAPRADGVPFLSEDERLLRVLAGTLGVVLDNVRFREREEHLRLLASRAELRALRAQINPHFLFNALNAIAGLIPENPALADETVEQLAQVFRYTLRKSEKEWARVDDEVEFAQAYLRVEQARFGSRMKIEIEVAPEAATAPIPAMTIQPLIENAVKHGVGATIGPAVVGLRAVVGGDDGLLHIEVFDNGPGFGQQPDSGSKNHREGGHGLRNVMERLKGYYGDSARLWWENAAEGGNGAHVYIRMPKDRPEQNGRRGAAHAG